MWLLSLETEEVTASKCGGNGLQPILKSAPTVHPPPPQDSVSQGIEKKTYNKISYSDKYELGGAGFEGSGDDVAGEMMEER